MFNLLLHFTEWKKTADAVLIRYYNCKIFGQIKNRQRPTFPGSFPPSIIGAKELNYCVRDGNRCDLLAIVTGFSACGFSIWLCCCSHPAVLMYLCTLRSSVLARLVSCKISCAVSCLWISPRNFSYFVPWKLNKSIKLVRKPLVKFSTY